MSKREDYEVRTEELITPILKENNFELVEVEYVKEAGTFYLRAYIDKPGGITIDDCELVSRALSEKLDKEDFIEEAYILEVSSPGLTRPFKKERDYTRNIGKKIEVKLYRMREKQKEFEGVLKSCTKDSFVIETQETELEFAMADCALVRLAIDF
ncbi:MAG: ribosome maturation factor RimP [Lachnospiraceae bacterium]|jgi:ribosome maturation factor RimP|nr:ribosome maturation factor RimP [Lachnospiraceae bacterium]